jgi:SNW domain-containing protein 1
MAKAGKNARDRDEDRDVSEAIALGKQVQPSVRGDAIYDARLFNQDGGLRAGFAPDDGNNAYDSRLFTDRSSAAGYRYDEKRLATARQEMDDAEAIGREKKRPVLGGSEQPMSGPLEFVTEGTGEDPFGLGDLLTSSSSTKKSKHI